MNKRFINNINYILTIDKKKKVMKTGFIDLLITICIMAIFTALFLPLILKGVDFSKENRNEEVFIEQTKLVK